MVRLAAGKLPPALLAELLSTPLADEAVRVGPSVGEDACAIDVPAGTLIAATDPITLTGDDIGRYAVIINANDVAVMGARPRWFLAVVLLPEGSEDSDVRAIFAAMRAALREVGAELVGGHTEVAAAVSQPVVIGQMLGFVERGCEVATGGARAGDVVVQIGSAPIEAASVLASARLDALAQLDRDTLELASRAATEPGISVVEAALCATGLGATALHDPTEGGLATGLHELAGAAGLRIEIDAARVLWFEPGRAVCRALGVDAWGALASGCALACFADDRAEAALAGLRQAGFDAAVIGRALAGPAAVFVDGTALGRFERDEVARLLAP